MDPKIDLLDGDVGNVGGREEVASAACQSSFLASRRASLAYIVGVTTARKE